VVAELRPVLGQLLAELLTNRASARARVAVTGNGAGSERKACAEGVGLGYHPFHHAALLARAHAFDFIELPLDLYLDAARAALLDPMDARLREITAGKPCVWRGSALSLGSVERAGEPTPDPRVVERIQLLMQRTGAGSYSDRIGFRCLDGADLGVPQSLPCTEAAANWVAKQKI